MVMMRIEFSCQFKSELRASPLRRNLATFVKQISSFFGPLMPKEPEKILEKLFSTLNEELSGKNFGKVFPVFLSRYVAKRFFCRMVYRDFDRRSVILCFAFQWFYGILLLSTGLLIEEKNL